MSTKKSHDDVRAAAIEAATGVVDAEGYHALNARKLAVAAGCSVGTLYNVFGDLDGVIYQMNLRTAQALHAELETAVKAAGRRPEDRLHALADAYFDFATAHPRRWDSLFRFRLKGKADGSVGRTGEALFGLLKDSVNGMVADDALLALWAAIHGVVELATQEHLMFYATGSERRYLRLILDTAFRGFAADGGREAG